MLLKNCQKDDISASAFIKEQANMTVQKAFEGQTIRALELAKENTFNLLNNLLYVTSKSLNVKENINQFQAFDIINTLLADYKDVKMEEFIYIFKQGKKGIYGPHYNKLDIETIVNWINSYFKSDEYNDHLENRHRKPIEKVELTKEQKDWWAKLANEFKEKEPFDGNVKKWVKTATEDQLNIMYFDFERAGHKEGVEIIKQEIEKRRNIK